MLSSTSISVHVAVATDGALVGGTTEQRGYLATWASWGTDQRDARCLPLPADPKQTVTIGPLQLPPLAELRGDETVWLKQYAYTDKSGIPQIDAKEAGHVVRTQPAGALSLPLLVLLKECAMATVRGGRAIVLRTSLVDPIMQQALFIQARGNHDLMDKATVASTKGFVTVSCFVQGKATAAAYLEQLQAAKSEAERTGSHLIHGSKQMLEVMVRAHEGIMAAHARHFFGADDGGAPLYPVNPREKSVENLHLFAYQSDAGVLPAQYYSLASACPVEAYDQESVDFLEQQVHASVHRGGFTDEAFLAAIREQHARMDAHVSPVYLKATAIVLDVGTFGANTDNYTSDQRFPNAATMTLHNGRDEEAVAAPMLCLKLAKHTPNTGRHGPRFHRKMCAAVRSLAQRLRRLAGKEKESAAGDALGVEDFSTGIAAGMTNAEDCEGDQITTTDIIDILEFLPLATHVKAGPLALAASEVCALRIMYDGGASVTSAYVDTEGNTLTPHKELADLPLIGDPVDEASQIGGHCHGVWPMKTIAADLHENGGADLAVEFPQLLAARQQERPWHRAIGMMLVSEGTGSTDPFVLPTEEVFGIEGAAEVGRVRSVYKTIREQAPTLADAFKFEGLSYYDTVQDKNRRVSPFYRGVSFLMSRRITQWSPRYGNCAIVVRTPSGEKVRGIEIGELLRAAALPREQLKHLSLVSAHAAPSEAKLWQEDIRPLAECILNQLPRSVFARFVPATAPLAKPRALSPAALPVRATFSEACARMNHPLSDRALVALGRMSMATSGELALAMDRLRLGARATASALAPPTPGTQHVAILYTQPWRLAQPGVADKAYAELAALEQQGIVASHDLARNRPLQQCLDTLELRLVLH